MKKKNIIVLVSIVVFLLLFAFQQNEIRRKNSVIENYESKSRKLEKDLEDLKKAHADEIAKIKESAKASEQPKPAEQTKPTEPVKTTQEPQKPVEQPKPAKSTEQPKKEDTNSLNEYNTGITFEQISKNPNQFKGKKVKFTGVVDKVVEQAGAGDMRFWIDNNANKAVYGAYINSTLNKKITEKTKLTIYGVFMDIVPYLADFGDGTTPYIIIDRVE